MYGINLHRWLSLSRIRSMCHLESQQSRENDPYFHYWPFTFDIQKNITFLWLWIGLFLSTVMIFITISTAHLLWVDLYLSIFLGFYALTFLPIPLFLLHHFWQNYLAPGLPLAGWTDDLPAQWKLQDTTRSLEAEIVNVIGTRSAKDERDCCYGVHGVLQRFGRNKATPPVDYTLSPAKVFLKFSVYLFQLVSPDMVLSLAFQHRCSEAPSWVPDFAQNFPLLPEKQKGFIATGHSKFYYRLHPESDGILIVKGYVWREVDTTDSQGRLLISGCDDFHTNADVRLGDKVALISGLLFPVVIRAKGSSFELLGRAYLYENVYNESMYDQVPGFITKELMGGSVWEGHVLDKRKAWEKAQTQISSSQDLSEVDAEVYLDDIAIC